MFKLGPTLAILALALMLPAAAHAGAVYVIETTDHSDGAGRVEQMQLSIEKPNLKMNVPGDGGEAGAPNEAIYQGKREAMVIIDHGEKSYMVMDKAAAKAMNQQMGQAMEQTGGAEGMEKMIQEALKDVPPEQRAEIEKMMRQNMPAQKGGKAQKDESTREFRKTGEKAKQQGYPCVKYEVVENGEVTEELWVTDWDNVEGGEDARDTLKSMAGFLKETVGSMGGGMANDAFIELEKLDGFPVVTRSFDGGKLTREAVLKSAKSADIEASAFEPPAGYTQRTMDQMQ